MPHPAAFRVSNGDSPDRLTGVADRHPEFPVLRQTGCCRYHAPVDAPAKTEALPAGLNDLVTAWVTEHGKAAELQSALGSSPAVAATLPRIIACSSYLADTVARYPQFLGELTAADRLGRPLADGELGQLFDDAIQADLAESECHRRLRQLRHRELLRIAWRDLDGSADVPETLAELSALADAALRAGLRWAAAQLQKTHGVPREADGSEATFAILAMGKLGGRELNFSSDVDLVFLYTDQGETDGARRLSNEQYFRRLAQQLINLMTKQTADGFVYRVDTRLRPFGDSGPLAVSVAAFEAYLLSHGRDWERYAYVKARVVNDWPPAGDLDREILRPFVYRRYLDYGVFSALRDMKAMIEAEGRRKEYSRNLKLGRGGIREIEFIVQSLQLVRGGTIADLRERELQQALPKLVQHQCLPQQVADELLAAYRLLRRTENRLQAIGDRQIHDLPDDDLTRLRLTVACGHPDWDSLAAELEQQREIVAAHFHQIVFRGSDDEGTGADDQIALAWSPDIDEPTLTMRLQELGYDEPAHAARKLLALLGSGGYRRMDEAGRQRLDALMPNLIRVAAAAAEPTRALDGAVQIVEAIGRRSAYLALLNENPSALERLVNLTALSQFLVQQIASAPLLLDELLDARIFTDPPDRDDLQADLQARLAAAGDDDPERRLYALTHFQQAATFRVAVADLSGALPLMKVSDRLTYIAEHVLQAAFDIAWAELTAKHGVPECDDDGQRRPASFAIVAYGKLGGLELGYGSDLDVVFIHDSTATRAETNGQRPLDNTVFFGRLTRRIIHMLTLATTSGSMYEVDTRLRPSGRSGLVVSSLTALDRYQQEDAWTWEHQALLRSRAVAGDPIVRDAYENLRRHALANYIKRDALKQDVQDMRERMRKELSKAKPGRFDLKQDHGGIADIEFIVQYLVLRDAHRYPDLTEFSDNIRQLDALARNALLPAADADALQDAYRDYRSRAHLLSLAGDETLVPQAEVAAEADRVIAIWQRVFG